MIKHEYSVKKSVPVFVRIRTRYSQRSSSYGSRWKRTYMGK